MRRSLRAIVPRAIFIFFLIAFRFPEISRSKHLDPRTRYTLDMKYENTILAGASDALGGICESTRDSTISQKVNPLRGSVGRSAAATAAVAAALAAAAGVYSRKAGGGQSSL